MRRRASSARATCSTGGIRRTGRGVRTHCSDDFLWLPLAACRYVAATGDTGVLDEMVAFLDGRAAEPGGGVLLRPARRARTKRRTLYEHCVRAVEHGLRFGAHGLPLMGSGDWNDGMNLVGDARQGRERLAGVLPVRGAAAVRAARRAARRRRRRSRCAAARVARSCAATIERTAGMATGIAAPTSTTARRSARQRTPNARSIPSPRAGRCSRAPATRALAAGDGRASTSGSCAASTALVQLLDPPFDEPALDPGYIKRLRAGRARERRPIHPCGDLGGDGVRGARRRRARVGTVRADQPGQPRRLAAGDAALSGRALRRRGRRLRRRPAHRPRRLDLVHRLRRAGCTG